MTASSRSLLIAWGVFMALYGAWIAVSLLLLDGPARRLTGGLLGVEAAPDRAFDRFYWGSVGGGKGLLLALAQWLFLAGVAFGPCLAYAWLLVRTRLLAPTDHLSALFVLGIPFYAAWFFFFCLGIDPVARKLVGAALGVTIGKQVWVSSFNWSILDGATTGKRVLVAITDAVVTGIGFLLPLAVAGLRLVRALGKSG